MNRESIYVFKFISEMEMIGELVSVSNDLRYVLIRDPMIVSDYMNPNTGSTGITLARYFTLSTDHLINFSANTIVARAIPSEDIKTFYLHALQTHIHHHIPKFEADVRASNHRIEMALAHYDYNRKMGKSDSDQMPEEIDMMGLEEGLAEMEGESVGSASTPPEEEMQIDHNIETSVHFHRNASRSRH